MKKINKLSRTIIGITGSIFLDSTASAYDPVTVTIPDITRIEKANVKVNCSTESIFLEGKLAENVNVVVPLGKIKWQLHNKFIQKDYVTFSNFKDQSITSVYCPRLGGSSVHTNLEGVRMTEVYNRRGKKISENFIETNYFQQNREINSFEIKNLSYNPSKKQMNITFDRDKVKNICR